MGNCATYYDEIRFSVRKPDTTEMWVYIRGEGDCPHLLLGWHYKAFPSTMTTLDILQAWLSGGDDPMMWPRMDPPPTVKNYDPDFEALETMIRERMQSRGNDKP